MKNHKLSKNSEKNLEGVDSRLIQLIKRVLVLSEHDFGIPRDGGKRTAKRQNQLFKKVPKVTNADGYIKLSYHQSGFAFDIFIYDEHGACWGCEYKYGEVAKIFFEEFDLMTKEGIFKENEIFEWGGDFKSIKDLPHFQIRTVK
ncbi:M15 family metallopeptidase [Tenacibaculum phage Larrie]|nr:M15 family metallopeptidase [Tenacibaculum phage Larrie]